MTLSFSENNNKEDHFSQLQSLLGHESLSNSSEFEFLEKCLSFYKDDIKSQVLLVKIFNKFGLTDFCKQATRALKSSKDPSALDAYIECLTITKRFIELTELADLKPELTKTHTIAIANAYIQLKLTTKAIDLLSRKKQKALKNFRLYQKLHQIYINNYQFLEAEYLMQEFKFHLPKMIPMHSLLVAKGFKASGETDKAIEQICCNCDIRKLNANQFNFLFGCLIDRGELVKLNTIIEYNIANLLERKHVVFNVIRHFVAKNDFSSAEHLLKKIGSSLEPGYETLQFLNITAQLKLRQFKYSEAYNIFIELVNDYGRTDKNTHLNLGYALTMQNKLTDARQYFDLTWTEDQKKENPNKNNINQYLYGRLWNEIALNTFGNKKIELALSKDNIDDCLKILKEVVLEEPHYTGGYLHYLSKLRLSGKLKPKSNSVSVNYIPKRIIQYWDDEAELAPDLKVITKTWKHHNPNWEYQLFNERTAIAFIGRHFPKSVLIAYMRCEKAAMKSDLFRLCYLAIHGGVYADTDDRCNHPLDPLLEGYKLVVFQDRWGAIANNFIAAEPRCPTIIHALNEVVANILDDPYDAIWYATGPGVASQCVAHTIASYSNASESPNWLRILTLKELYEYVWPHTKNAYKSTSKHWLNSDN